MKIVYMGTPDFAVPALQSLQQSSHEVLAVVTGPDRPVGRGRKLLSPPVKQKADEFNYPVLQPAKLSDRPFQDRIADLKAELLVVVAFRILPDSLLSITRLGAVNLHPSLLPKYRGAAPIQHCLLNGETITGITTITLSNRIDAGHILLQREEPITPHDDFGTLSERLSKKGARLLVETVDGLEAGALNPRPQAELAGEPGAKAPKIKPADLRIDWPAPAERIMNQIRAFSPGPGAVTNFGGKRLKLFNSTTGAGVGPPGQVLDTTGGRLEIATGEGSLLVAEVQIEGRRRLTVSEFLRGITLSTGEMLG